MQVAPLWFSAQWSFNASLSMTSVTSNTILASLASLFAFFGSVLFLGERFTALKLVFIACAVAGDAFDQTKLNVQMLKKLMLVLS